jgi:Tfp pilus assembly protein PilE
MTVVPLDIGRSSTKLVMGEIRKVLPSYVGEYRRLNLSRELTELDKITEYNEQFYYVGKIAAEESEDAVQMMTNTKAHFRTKIIGLTMIGDTVKDGDDVFLILTVPISNHNESEKQKLRTLFLGEYKVKINDTVKHFSIKRVEVVPECAIYAWYLKLKGLYHVIDGGSRTINYVTAKDGGWNDKLSGTIDYGFETNISSFNSELFGSKIAGDIGKRLKTTTAPIITIGGQADFLARALQPYFPQVEIDQDGLFANAIACEALGGKLNAEPKA